MIYTVLVLLVYPKICPFEQFATHSEEKGACYDVPSESVSYTQNIGLWVYYQTSYSN